MNNPSDKRGAVKPNPNAVFPMLGVSTATYVKPTIQSKNITVGDFTYFSGTDFEREVAHHYDFCGDQLIIGKFCQIAAGVDFIMNGANHPMNGGGDIPFFSLRGLGAGYPYFEVLAKDLALG